MQLTDNILEDEKWILDLVKNADYIITTASPGEMYAILKEHYVMYKLAS